MSERLSHLGDDGEARMVDVGAKDVSERSARARARVRMAPATAALVERGDGPKGEVLNVARLAGVLAAKQTAQLIPLAHPLELTFVDVTAEVRVAEGAVVLEAEARTRSRTGVEMEAMTACSVAALTVYDMVKGVERGVEIDEIVLLEKHGGRHDYTREEPAGASAGPERPPHRDPAQGLRAAVITVSTSKSAGDGRDESGPLLAALAGSLGAEVVARELVGDDRGAIEARLRHWVRDGCGLVLTSGGTGVAPGDVTPEATAAVIEREVPGLAEAMRAASRAHTEHWALSRGLAGIAGATLIVNLPGSPRAVEQLQGQLAATLPHALELLAGRHPH